MDTKRTEENIEERRNIITVIAVTKSIKTNTEVATENKS
jgi:hypothetical protein